MTQQDVDAESRTIHPRRISRIERGRRIFDQYDHDLDGKIPIPEFKSIINSFEYRDGDIPDITIRRIMRMSDTHCNGFISFEMFISMMPNHTTHQNIFSKICRAYVDVIVPRQHYGDEPGLYSDSYEEEYSCCPPPVFMLTISVIEFILYIIDVNLNQSDGTGPITSALSYNPYKRYEAWRYVSYMFVHSGSDHLMMNLLIQLFLGVPLEMVHKWWRVLLVYLAGVAAGSLGTSITDPSVFLAGASGGVYALLIAHLVIICINWADMEFPVCQLLIFICLIYTDVAGVVLDGMDESVGYVAHLAGAIAGLLVGICVLRNLQVKSCEQTLWYFAVVIYILLMSIAILMNIFWTDHFPRSHSD